MGAKQLHSKASNKRPKRRVTACPETERVNSLPWNSSLSNSDDDPFSLLVGTNNLEGGFLSLEEIDETEYGLIPEPTIEDGKETPGRSSKPKKRKRGDDNSSSINEPEGGSEDKMEKEEAKVKEKKKRKKDKTKKPKKKSEAVFDGNSIGDTEGDSVDEVEFHAWNELRLHPTIMKSIYRLGFKEPTPIQKASIPCAAHQGKDVIGAAETGSGKTLAFGLPIFQRLLEEQEKVAKMSSENEERQGIIAPQGLLRALIITPTRELALQVSDHLKEVSKGTNIRVVAIVGGMSTEKQERLLKARPEVIVGTPGRLWELMSGGEHHLVELHSLSFFVLDEADRMIENGHFHELQSIIDMLPTTADSSEGHSNSHNCLTVSSFQRKKRQTLVFSATIALSSDFRKKLKRGSLTSKQSRNSGLTSIGNLSERAGMRADAAIIDLTNASIIANKLEESFLECREEDKDAYLYYILSVHGQGRTIVFCTSIAALRHISSILRVLGINVTTLHAQMQQRARLKAIDRFRGNENGILVATDVAARGLDIPGVRTVIHYQLPHSAEVYVHRSGRTARASGDGCSIALISPNDRSKFGSLCKSFSKDSLQSFPLQDSYMPEILKRLSITRQIDKILRKESQEKAKQSWFQRNAESVGLALEENESEEERVNSSRKKKDSSIHLKKLQQELNDLLSHPLQPKTLSHRYLAGAGVSPLLQHQFEELVRQKIDDSKSSGGNSKSKMVVIGQDRVEPLHALRSAGHEICMHVEENAEKRRKMVNVRRKKKEEKKSLRDQRRKQRKRLKRGE